MINITIDALNNDNSTYSEAKLIESIYNYEYTDKIYIIDAYGKFHYKNKHGILEDLIDKNNLPFPSYQKISLTNEEYLECIKYKNFKKLIVDKLIEKIDFNEKVTVFCFDNFLPEIPKLTTKKLIKELEKISINKNKKELKQTYCLINNTNKRM